MRKLVLLMGATLLIFAAGCKEEVLLTELEQFNLELARIDSWIAENGITDTLHHPTKIVYTINKQGTGTIKPRLTDNIFVAYEGRFLESGEVFDSSTGFSVILNETILGWKIMVQEMRDGDKFTIYLPSFYGYGTEGFGERIPPNSTIVFDIELIRIEG